MKNHVQEIKMKLLQGHGKKKEQKCCDLIWKGGVMARCHSSSGEDCSLNHWLNLTNERRMRRAQKQPWKVNSRPHEALGAPATSSPSELVAWKPVWGQCICSLCTPPWNGRSRSNLLRPDAVQTKRRPRRAAGWKGRKWTERRAVAAPGEVALAPFYTWLGNTCRTVRHMLPLPHGGPWWMRSTWS